MSNSEEAREAWEYEIDEMRRSACQTHDEDDQTVRDEKGAIIACLIRGYEERFGMTYPNTLTQL